MPDPPPSDTKCKICGAAVIQDAPLGHCPKCLVKLGFLDDPANKVPPSNDDDGVPESRRFAQYRLLRQIGKGGMGVVYEACHRHLHRSVALKVILDSELSSPVALRRFQIEAEAAARLDHPHIVPIYEVGEWEGQPFIAMKLVHGESLRVRMQYGEYGAHPGLAGMIQLPWHERQTAAIQLIAKVTRAVQHAHEQGVLHRDLKPGNILIDDQGQPYLTDFSLAKMVDEHPGDGTTPPLTLSGSVLGTPGYMSPEQAAGRKVSAATDIYSLGAILYELLTGRPPFHATTPVETMRLVLDQPPIPPRAQNALVHRDLDTICLKCLEKNPAARYATAAALADDLERWLRHEPVKARRIGLCSRMSRWVKRNPIGTLLIVSLVFSLAIILYLLHLVWVRAKDTEHQRDVIIHQERIKIRNDWLDTNLSTVKITSEVLSVLGGYREPEQSLGNLLRLTFAVNPLEDPVSLAKTYVPLLKHLENELGRRLRRPIRFDLLLCHEGFGEWRIVATGECDFQRMGALPYLYMHNLNPAAQPIVREDIGKQGVICVRRDLYDQGVTNLAQLARHSFAFGSTNSTISLMAKILLAHAGIRGSSLTTFTNYAGHDPDSLRRFAEVEAKMETSFELPLVRSLRVAVRAANLELYDAAVSRRDYFEHERYRDKGLVALQTFETPPDVYVARAGLDIGIVHAMRESLVAIKDEELLANLPLQGLKQFLPASDADFAGLRQDWINHAQQFTP